MKILPSRPVQPHNRLLAALATDQYACLEPHLELVRMEVREIVYDVGRPISHVYFVESGILSIVSPASDGSAVETATVGFEGMVGVPVFLDTDRSAATQAFCQISGESLRMPADAFRRATQETDLRPVLNRYIQALFTQVAQSSACNRLHPVSQRCARWLLQTHDRMERRDFPLTQGFLSQMLGVRRATVAAAAGHLQSAGLIEYAHGIVTVKDRAGLERTSCECYAVVRSEFDRLLDGHSTPSPLDGLQASIGGKTTLNNGTPRREPQSDE